jgi:hypothetical protein
MPAELTGSWLETVTLNGETSSGDAGASFQTLFTYDSGGGLTGAGSVDLSTASLTGPSHGAWVRTGPSAYQWLAHAFAFANTSDPAGLYTIRETIILADDGLSYTATGSYDVVAAGRSVSGGQFTVSAQRVTV